MYFYEHMKAGKKSFCYLLILKLEFQVHKQFYFWIMIKKLKKLYSFNFVSIFKKNKIKRVY